MTAADCHLMRFNLYSTPDLKAAADEALPHIFDAKSYKQEYTKEFMRLAMGLTSAAIAAGVYYAEREWGFWVAYPYIALGVVAYAMLNFLAWFWQKHVELGAVYIGRSPDKRLVYVSTHSPAHTDEYIVTCTIDGNTSTVRSQFPDFVDAHGGIVRANFMPIIDKALAKAIGKQE